MKNGDYKITDYKITVIIKYLSFNKFYNLLLIILQLMARVFDGHANNCNYNIKL